MSKRNVVFNVRVEEEIVERFRTLSDLLKCSHGDLFKDMVNKYEEVVGLGNELDDISLIIKEIKNPYDGKIIKIRGKVVYTTNLRKPSYHIYLNNLRKILVELGTNNELDFIKNMDDAELIAEKEHTYKENIFLYKTVGGRYVFYHRKELFVNNYGYLDYSHKVYNSKVEAINKCNELLDVYEHNDFIYYTAEGKDVEYIE